MFSWDNNVDQLSFLTSSMTLSGSGDLLHNQNRINSNAIYNAVYDGMTNANVAVYIDGQKMTDTVNRHNSINQYNRMRFNGA